MAITRDDIIQAAEAIERDGGNPTMAAVREFLNGGSFATISPILREWKESRKVRHAVVIDMPGELKAALDGLGAEFWQVASRLSNEKLIAVQAEAESSVNEAQSERDETLQEVARLEKELSEALGESQQAQAEQDRTLKDLAEQKEEFIRLREQLLASQQLASQLKTDLGRMTEEKDRQAEQAATLQGLSDQQKLDLEESRVQLTNLQEQNRKTSVALDSSQGREKLLITERDQLKQQSGEQATELMKLRTSTSALNARVEDRNGQIATLEADNKQLRQTSQKAVTLEAELKVSRNRGSELTAERDQLKQENRDLLKQTGQLEGQLKAQQSQAQVTDHDVGDTPA
ncbi:MAG: DNA-binding protein [Endozoicomonas sp.]